MLRRIENKANNNNYATTNIINDNMVVATMCDTEDNRYLLDKIIKYVNDNHNMCDYAFTCERYQLIQIVRDIADFYNYGDSVALNIDRELKDYANAVKKIIATIDYMEQKANEQKQTAKEKTVENVANYLDYANGFDCHIAPTKTIHSGKDGNAFEMLVKLALGNYRFNGIALKGRTDTTKKINGNMVKFEIKQGCSELGFINELGEKHITVLDKDIIIYMPTYTLNMNIENAYVMNTNDFINMLDSLNLIRYKKSSAMCKRPKEQQYKDRIAIQSFSNSIKKETALYDALETNAIKLKDFIAQYGIKSIAL